mmetsp:Transcript_22421/g.33555  ORF Transcript_22421/g.33555 Transcript_22421/m.33555 type:complete len:378 (+) Transcript_22421:58-1191(+)
MLRTMIQLRAILLAVFALTSATDDTEYLNDFEDSRITTIDNGDTRWEKVLMTDAASNHGAVCLDGSPGGYYIRRRLNHIDDTNTDDENNWVIFHQGGGWCGSDTNCLRRSRGRFGSSNSWGPTYDESQGSEIFSSPLFENYTIVFAMYCDGSSWTSDVDHPVIVRNRPIYYRGHRLLEALIHNLVHVEGLKNATNVLYSGCSAGGLTALLHIDYIASRLSVFSPNATFLGLSDGMFSLDRNQFNTRPGLFQRIAKWGYSAWNSSSSINEACRESHGIEDEWKCMFAEHVSMHVETPVFFLNSKYDPWQMRAILGIRCEYNVGCPAHQERAYVQYGQSMVRSLKILPEKHGYFVSNCIRHCMAGSRGSWNIMTIDNVK